MTSDSIAQQLDRIATDLTAEFAGAVPAETVLKVVDGFRAELEPTAKITDYLPVLVRRYARESLVLLTRRPLAV